MIVLLSEGKLIELYTIKNMSDQEIADMYSVSRSTITHRRRKFGIRGKETLHEKILPLVVKLLDYRGYGVKNLKNENKLSPIDILLNDTVKVKVMTATKGRDGTFKFILTNPARSFNKVSENRIRLENGRYRPIYNNICDVIIFVGIDNDRWGQWIIPSNIIDESELQTLSLKAATTNKFFEYYKNWDILDSLSK